MAEGEGGAGANPGTLPHKRSFEVPLRRAPDEPDHSTQAFGKKQKNKNKPHPNPPQVVVFLAPALHFQGLPSSLLSFVKSISKGGKKKSENGTKQNVTTLTWGAQQLALSPGGPGCSRAGQPLYTGSAFAPRSREGERSLPLSRVEAPRPDV